MTLAKRIIGVILLENNLVVRRVGFKTASIIGRPEVTIKYLSNWDVDEIAIINVGEKQDMRQIIKRVTRECFLPVSVGGSISSLDEAGEYIKCGAEKIILGKYASRELCEEIANVYGAQSIIVSIDEDHEAKIKEINEWNCGEVILHSKDRDGKGIGLNLELAKLKTDKNIILMAGVGNYEHITEGLIVADAVAVGNLFSFYEHAAKEAKKKAKERGVHVRM